MDDIIYLDPETYEWLVVALERPPRELPHLKKLMETLDTDPRWL